MFLYHNHIFETFECHTAALCRGQNPVIVIYKPKLWNSKKLDHF